MEERTMIDAMETRRVTLRDLEAESGCRGVLVRCPRFEVTLDIGECLFCEHYQGLWLGERSRCALRCAFASDPSVSSAA
jgi:hypothetical protein